MDKRDYLLDNIKGIMIILVIFGHTITHLYMGGNRAINAVSILRNIYFPYACFYIYCRLLL